jgi:ATP-dependent Clp protease ATP-binding subunit ClpX
MTEEKLHCSFCGKPASEVKKLIAGSSVFICDECVDLCYGILHEEARPQDKNSGISTLLPPREIKEFLDQYVIGQEDAKEVLAVAVYNHYKRLANPIIDDVEIDKSNVLMIGPTGVGKTLLVQTLARMLSVPLAIADATSLTEAGYVGDDVESIITRLLQASNFDIKLAERGIIFIDEIDKKKTGVGGSSSRDVSGEGVQQALLKLLEGSEVFVPPQGSRKNPNTEMIKINTKGILFVVGGAFVGLDKIVDKAVAKDATGIGFGAKNVGRQKASTSELLRKVEPDHLVTFGMIPELIGRLPVLTALDELNEDQLMRVLLEPKNAIIKQMTKMFALEGVELEFTPEALRACAKIARARKTGGRALRSVLESALMKTQFRLPDLAKDGVTRIVITDQTITNHSEPELVRETPPAEGETT